METDDSKPVRQCCCYPHTFADILQQANAHGWTTTNEIAAHLGCGTGCGLCRPYLARMLRTGETAFSVITTEDTE